MRCNSSKHTLFRRGLLSQVMGAVEEKYGQVDESLQIQDTADWDAENKRRALVAAGMPSRGTTPAKAPQPVQRRQMCYDDVIDLGESD